MGILDSYKDDDLNFGRLLVLMPRSKETVATIKRSTGSKYAKRVTQAASQNEVMSHLYETVCEGLKIKSGRWEGYYRIYQVDNDSASTFAALGLDGFVAAVEINAQDFRKLDNAVDTHKRAKQITHRIEEVGNLHRNFVYALGQRKGVGLIDVYTASIETLEESYGHDIQSKAEADINELLANRW